ncbi:hypothetical protein HNV11_06875 [Spirosoma taeanense]|uniref:Uncharacterized protein n=1 Tax=Spirosoma taeanense TaxID=2735870 RepID=A0A6M5Y7Q4_9BACT|nr:DUF5908 family protein [Spirosoma taeanense]QJW89133.1 hypothetical protein HNV11_06875 [Spirosoma taeanense]
MPIEIRELVIRARVDETETASQTDSGNRRGGTLTRADREAIIAACVEQVMQMLEDKQER